MKKPNTTATNNALAGRIEAGEQFYEGDFENHNIGSPFVKGTFLYDVVIALGENRWDDDADLSNTQRLSHGCVNHTGWIDGDERSALQLIPEDFQIILQRTSGANFNWACELMNYKTGDIASATSPHASRAVIAALLRIKD